MVKFPVLQSKLMRPHLATESSILLRPRLQGIRSAHRVMVTAPAGYGKSTAVLTALKDAAPVFWYRLEREDSRLAVFYATLTECLFGGLPDLKRSALTCLRSSFDFDQGMDSELFNALLCQDLWSLYGQRNQAEAWLVLDDLHWVEDSPVLMDTLRFFLENLPPRLHLILISRSDPGLFDGRVGLKPGTLKVTSQDLSLTEDEMHRFLTGDGEPRVSKKLLQRIFLKTEGWFAGVIMIRNILSKSSEPEVLRMLEHAGDYGELFRYFTEETLRGDDPEFLKTLAMVATLEEFSLPDLRGAFGIVDGEAMVRECEKKSLFLQRTGTGSLTYRYHALFRDVLLAIRGRLFAIDEIRGFHRQAANWFQRTGATHTAVRHLLEAGNEKAAAELMAAEGERLLDSGFNLQVRSLVELFPEETVWNDAHLSYFYGFILKGSEFQQGCRYLEQSALLFADQGNADMQVKALAMLMIACTQRNEMPRVGAYVRQINKLGTLLKSEEARGIVLVCLLGKTVWEDRLQRALLLEKTLEMVPVSGLWLQGVNNFRCMLHYRLGNLETACAILEDNWRLPIVQNNDQWRIINLVLGHTVAYLNHDTAWSARIRDELLMLGETYQSDYALGFGKRDAAFARFFQHDYPGAIGYLKDSTLHFMRYQNIALALLNRLLLHLWSLEQDPAQANIEECLEVFNELKGMNAGQGLAEVGESILGVLYRESGQLDAAEKLLISSYLTSQKKKSRQMMAGTAMHLAQLYYDKGETHKGDRFLKIWVDTSFSHDYVVFRDLFFPTLVTCSARCLLQGLHPKFVLEVLGLYFSGKAVEKVASDPNSFLEREAARRLVLRESDRETAQPMVRISLLGDFAIRTERGVLTEADWKTRKAQRILKYLIVNRGQPVSRDTLMALFWPESGKKAAMASLSVALYEIRKVLSRYGLAPEGEFQLFSESENGFVLRGDSNLEVDTELLAGLYGRLQKPEGFKRTTDLEAAVRLYRGDYLPGERYEDWTGEDREKYRGMFLELGLALARHYIEAGIYPEAEELLTRLRKADPQDEAVVLVLCDLYEKTRREKRAQFLRSSLNGHLEGLSEG
ncbi:MAG: hypothetical protein HPY50_20905 [Firmicutes bacterium]|nr:hypothetical protein [Bacillota bacterium]